MGRVFSEGGFDRVLGNRSMEQALGGEKRDTEGLRQISLRVFSRPRIIS
jgi:hypothetical protein